MLKRIVIYASAFIFPPLFFGLISTFSTLSTVMLQKAPTPLSDPRPLPAPPALTQRLKAAILVSTEGTQITDLMAPFELLGASGAFDVYTVARARTLSPTTAPLAILPHYTFQDAPAPDLLVLPAVLESGHRETIQWVEKAAQDAKLTLSVCEGARIAVEAHLFRDHSGTSHFMALDGLRQLEPSAKWIRGSRYILDRQLLSTAGVTASLDGTLAAIQKLAGFAAAEAARASTSYTAIPTHGRATFPSVTGGDFLQIFLRAGFDWWRDRVAVLVYPGISEIGLAAPLDTFARTQSLAAFTVAPRREPIRTAHGLDVIPAEAFSANIKAELLWVPEGVQPSSGPEIESPGIAALRVPETQAWIAAANPVVKSFALLPPGNAYDRALQTLVELQGPAITRFVAKMIEDPRLPPSAYSNAPFQDWPPALWFRPLLIGLLTLALGIALERRVVGMRRKKTVTPTPKAIQ